MPSHNELRQTSKRFIENRGIKPRTQPTEKDEADAKIYQLSIEDMLKFRLENDEVVERLQKIFSRYLEMKKPIVDKILNTGLGGGL